MPDFIPIVGVGGGTGLKVIGGQQTAVPGVLVTMSSVYKATDGEVHFIARFYYAGDETNRNNQGRLIGDADGNGEEPNYDFPDAYHADCTVGFTLPANQGDTPTFTNVQGSGHSTKDYQSFLLQANTNTPFVYVLVAVHKVLGYNARFTSARCFENTGYALTLDHRVAELQATL